MMPGGDLGLECIYATQPLAKILKRPVICRYTHNVDLLRRASDSGLKVAVATQSVTEDAERQDLPAFSSQQA